VGSRIVTENLIMQIFSKKLLLKSGTIIFDDDYLMASSKRILAASNTTNFIYKNTPQLLEDTLSNQE